MGAPDGPCASDEDNGRQDRRPSGSPRGEGAKLIGEAMEIPTAGLG